MKKKLDLFEPSPYFAWVVHLDGMRERHDQFVEREGVFDKAVDAIVEAKRRGFRINTNTTFLTTDTPKTVRDVMDFLNDELQVDQMMISPAYAYEKAPDQEHFPASSRPGGCSRRLSRTATGRGGASTTRRSSSTSSRARPTSSARPGGSPRTRSSAGSGPAT